MSGDLNILREIGEKLHPQCEKKQKISLQIQIKNKIRYFKPRRTIGRWILGKPIPGQGILMQVDLGYRTKEEVDYFWQAIKLLRKAGIRFDSGMGCKFDMELDWSLRGAVVICKKCGYNSEENRIQLDLKDKKEHFITTCVNCNKKLDSNAGYHHIKKHFWNETLYYHLDCYGPEREE